MFQGKQRFGEVQFFFQAEINAQVTLLAIVSLYTLPDERLLELSYHSLVVCTYEATRALVVIEAQTILSIVVMVPYTHVNLGQDLFYVVGNWDWKWQVWEGWKKRLGTSRTLRTSRTHCTNDYDMYDTSVTVTL